MISYNCNECKCVVNLRCYRDMVGNAWCLSCYTILYEDIKIAKLLSSSVGEF